MLAHDPSQHRRTFDLDSKAVSALLLSHWTGLGLAVESSNFEVFLQALKELILCGGSESELVEKLALYDRSLGVEPDLYACHVSARALLAL